MSTNKSSVDHLLVLTASYSGVRTVQACYGSQEKIGVPAEDLSKCLKNFLSD